MSQLSVEQDDESAMQRRRPRRRLRAQLDPFSPFPGMRRRTLVRWVLLGGHLLPFAAVVFLAYPGDSGSLFMSNMGRMAVQVWAFILLVHAAVVVALDVREGIIFARQERQRARQRAEFRSRDANEPG